MNSEERFTKIDNTLNSLVEHHARHAEEMAEMRSEFRSMQSEFRSMQKVVFLAIERTVEMQQAGAKRFDEEMQRLREAQQTTEEKLNALIDTVDRIIRERGGGSA